MPMTYRSRRQVEDDRPRSEERPKKWLDARCHYHSLRQLSQEVTMNLPARGKTARPGSGARGRRFALVAAKRPILPRCFHTIDTPFKA